jgi:hypothetical protein
VFPAWKQPCAAIVLAEHVIVVVTEEREAEARFTVAIRHSDYFEVVDAFFGYTTVRASDSRRRGAAPRPVPSQSPQAHPTFFCIHMIRARCSQVPRPSLS